MRKYPKTGCLVIAGLLFVGLLALVFTKPGSRGYLDYGYQKDYAWGDLEMGTILRLPIGTIVPTGRNFSVIVFPSGNISEARIICSMPGGEIPTRPEFLSGKDHVATYRIPHSDTEASFLLTEWKSFPLRTKTSPKPILDSPSTSRTEGSARE